MQDPFALLDKALLPLIEGRKASAKAATLPKVLHRWTPKDADVGEFKTGRPNKQQHNQMVNQKIDWEQERREERRTRRVECEDWVSVALSDLKEERDYLDQYGVEGFFAQSIAKLEALDAARK